MRILAVIGALASIVVIAAGGFFFGGFYSVAATDEDPGIVNAALIQVRVASIGRHAVEPPPAQWDDPAMVRAGAHAFATRGCVNCHGAPGMLWAKFSEGLNPGPPDLKNVVGGIPPRALFWVIRNGIRMTGMPSFNKAGVPDPEIWQMVAFLKKLPTVSDADFKTWSMSGP